MLFPEADRVIYRKNPLQQVICQLRFPTILKIDAETPVQFQEEVRSAFPYYSEQVDFKAQPPEGLQDQIRRELLKSVSTKNHRFSSEASQWTINLTRGFLALSASKYKRWEEFKEKLKIPMMALDQVYSPTHFSRVGLRYTDLIQRSTLDLDDVDWTELLNPHILGVLSSKEIADSVRNSETGNEIVLADDQGVVRVVTKLLRGSDEEMCFMIDADFFCEGNILIREIMEKLNSLNQCARRFFRWCITDRLHTAMEPENL